MGGPSAIDDILNNPRFQGAIDSISGITGFVDSIFVMFISFIAFFIISAALLRNVIAGAYAAYPKLFDWVAEAKESGINKVQGINKVGPILGFFLRLIPDFKNLSDFHDDTVEPKHYFMKAIPQMIGVVMIGVVIYNGFYRDAVSITAGFGSQIISRVLLSVDPVAVFDKLANTSGNPTFANDSATTTKGKLVNNLSKDIYGKIISFYTDINGEASKSDLGRQIEDYVTTQVNSLNQDLLIEGAWSVQKQVTRVFGEPSVTGLSSTDTDIMKTVGWSIPITKQFSFSTAKNVGEDWWLRVVLRFKKEAESAPVTGTSSSLEMQVPPASVTSGSYVTINIPTNANVKLVYSGQGNKVKIENNKLIFTDITHSTNLKTIDTSSMAIFYSTGTGQSSKITSIVINKSGIGSTIKFTDNTGKLSDFVYGEVPVEKAK